MIKKISWAFVLLALLGTARCYNADFASAVGGLPIVGPIVQPSPATPSYVYTIGTPAAVTLPEAKYDTWFPAETDDPYSLAVWKQVELFLPIAGTTSGWAEACKAVSAVAGADRTASPKLGALACSNDPTVTQMQQVAAHFLGVQASVALWMKGELNGSTGAIQARQAELRVLCTTSVVARLGGEGAPWQQACELGMDASYLSGDGPSTFAALDQAYTLVAEEIARLDPEIDQEPGTFGTAAGATPTP